MEQGIWKIRTDRELRELYKGLDIVSEKNKILEWIGTSGENGSWKGS